MLEEELQQVYDMVDSIPFSRAKKNINRDFSDGLMMAELIYHYNPKLVSLHNYPPANSVNKKIDNWNILNNKVLKKMNIFLSKQQIEDIANAAPNIIEQLLYQILVRFEKPDEEGRISENLKKVKPNNQNGRNGQNENQQEKRSNKGEDTQYKAVVAGQINHENYNRDAEEILELVALIDHATANLAKLQQTSRIKDEVIKNLQKKLEKIIYA